MFFIRTVPPSDGPILMEEKSDYELGDNVSILCNSGRSKPAPELKWYINDQLVSPIIIIFKNLDSSFVDKMYLCIVFTEYFFFSYSKFRSRI